MVKNVLRKKLFRDIRINAMQFFSIILLCTLGTFAFSALSGTSQMIGQTVEHYFDTNNIADYWVTLNNPSDNIQQKIQNLQGVTQCNMRTSLSMTASLPHDPALQVVGYQDAMEINRPLLRKGELLLKGDNRGCMIQERFATAHSLAVGDRIKAEYAGFEFSFIIRGIVLSPEFVCNEKGAINAAKQGYILVNAPALSPFPINQMVITTNESADAETIKKALSTMMPEAFIQDHSVHQSTVRIKNDSQMFHNMIFIFPGLAYAVATLIVMTTLTRMIENERLQIGSLQAMGFPSKTILSHYLSYAFLPSLVGSLLGIILGHITMPYILWDALISQHEMPYRLTPPIDISGWLMVLLTVFMSILVCLFTFYQATKDTTASLLRPKPPKEGKRILLERISLFWKHLSFNNKVVIRSLFRNKMRSFMSLLGILSCNMLLITSMGLQDSITILTKNYYTKTLSYDIVASLEGEVGTKESYEKRVPAELVECIMVKPITLSTSDGLETTTLSVLADSQQLIRLGQHETLIPLPDNGLLITQKLAKKMDISLGDELKLSLLGDDEPFLLKVDNIVVSTVVQGIYINDSTWDTLRKGPFTPTAIQILGPAENCDAILADMDEVEEIDRPNILIDEMLEMLKTLSSVFSILTFIALSLAFVICYNMGLMNFVERTREYATLKVLGYHQKEIRKLIMHENMIIAFLGVVGGIYPGILLTDIVMHSCEPELGFYPGEPAVQSIVIACVVTFLFSIFISRVLTMKVKKIVMVEALKSVE